MKELTNLLWEDFQQLRQMDGIHWGELPDYEGVKKLVKQLHRLVYFRGTQQELGKMIRQAYDQLMSQLEKVCPDEDTDRLCMEFLSKIPSVRAKIEKDLLAAFEGDPAATGYDEIVLAYPGLYAITVYRLAHELYNLHVPLIPRTMTELAHSTTGVDIHPGATIGEYFFIDHGTGIVIGQTTIIGDHVKLYQGVTLGGLSTRGGQKLSGAKRHPTIEDSVTIYAGATILGGETVIGRGSVIGANAFVTCSIPEATTVTMKQPELQLRKHK